MHIETVEDFPMCSNFDTYVQYSILNFQKYRMIYIQRGVYNRVLNNAVPLHTYTFEHVQWYMKGASAA